MLFPIQKLNLSQAEEGDKIFLSDLGDLEKTEEMWQQLDDSFFELSDFEIQPYFLTYWRWYAELAWQRFNTLSQEELINLVMGRMIPILLLLGYDVFNQMMWYFKLHTFDEKDSADLFVKIKNSLFTSNAVLGKLKGVEVTVAQMAQELFSQRNVADEDSMKRAEYYTKMQEVLYSKNDPLFNQFIFSSPEVVINNFIELYAFFDQVQPNKIWQIVLGYGQPPAFQDQNIIDEENIESSEKLEDGKESYPQKAPEDLNTEENITNLPNNNREISSEIEVKEPEILLPQPIAPNEIVSVKNSQPQIMPKEMQKESEQEQSARQPVQSENKINRPGNLTIRNMVEAVFPPATDGQIEDTAGVIKMLGSLADRYQDPSIAEIYYYNEEEGNFQWKQ